MNRLHFSIEIKADKPTIWNALWNEENYRLWASVFFEGSYIVVDNWGEGSKVLFLGPDRNGIYSKIESYIANNSVTFKHIGNVLEGKEQAVDEETKLWSGATETYSITEDENGTHLLSIEIDVMNEHLEFMNEKLPLALEKIKNMCN